MFNKMSAENQNKQYSSMTNTDPDEEDTMMEVDGQGQDENTISATFVHLDGDTSDGDESDEGLNINDIFDYYIRQPDTTNDEATAIATNTETIEDTANVDTTIADTAITDSAIADTSIADTAIADIAIADTTHAEETADVAYTSQSAAQYSSDESSSVARSFYNSFTNIADEEPATDEETKSAIELAQEQLFIDWCTSRQILFEKDDE